MIIIIITTWQIKKKQPLLEQGLELADCQEVTVKDK